MNTSYTLMKTVLVLTLLAVAIACCYAGPTAQRKSSLSAWQASHPVKPKYWSWQHPAPIAPIYHLIHAHETNIISLGEDDFLFCYLRDAECIGPAVIAYTRRILKISAAIACLVYRMILHQLVLLAHNKVRYRPLTNLIIILVYIIRL